jgi:hypothetical protein
LAWFVPLWTTGALLLIHNAVAFVYWVLSAKDLRERKVALFSMGIFLFITCAIFFGCFDFIYKFFSPTAQIDWAGLGYVELGQFIAPWSDNYVVWFHGMVAYAFGQSLHSFVWLKAIPDQHHSTEVPASFRKSYRLLIRDFGKPALGFIVLLVLAMWAIVLFVDHPEARAIYFAIAAYHGYLEIAALGLAPLGSQR